MSDIESEASSDVAVLRLNPKEIAEASADAMAEGDNCSRMLGIELVEVDEQQASVRMTVVKDMVNGHNLCHGGMIFTLADCAFAFACNSENHSSVAAAAQIDFLAPAKLGDELKATAIAVNQGKRKGLYDVTVVDQSGKQIAVFRGQSHRLGGPMVELPQQEE